MLRGTGGWRGPAGGNDFDRGPDQVEGMRLVDARPDEGPGGERTGRVRENDAAVDFRRLALRAAAQNQVAVLGRPVDQHEKLATDERATAARRDPLLDRHQGPASLLLDVGRHVVLPP